MPFHSLTVRVKPRVGRPMSLSVGHVDPKTLTLVLHYQEQQKEGTVWSTVDLEYTLSEGIHYALDARNGAITLLDHDFWRQESTWRLGGEGGYVESLLYKGRVKYPQCVRAEFEHYAPTPVEPGAKVDWDKTNREAKKRLGYDVPEYGVGV